MSAEVLAWKEMDRGCRECREVMTVLGASFQLFLQV